VKTVTLTRYFYSDTQTRGILSVEKDGEEVFSCKTLELPWAGNENRKSCIPPGPNQSPQEYTLCHRSAAESGKFNYPHFLVEGVEGRSYILIHRGNYYFQVLGCIIPGVSFVDINEDGHPDVTSSRETLRNLLEAVPDGTKFVVESAEERAASAEEKAERFGPVPAAEPDSIDLPDIEVPTQISA